VIETENKQLRSRAKEIVLEMKTGELPKALELIDRAVWLCVTTEEFNLFIEAVREFINFPEAEE
jgi:hypothetical protein